MKKKVDTSTWTDKEIERGYAVRRRNGFPIYIYADGETSAGAPRETIQPDKIYNEEEPKSYKFSSRFNREKREKEVLDTLNNLLDEDAKKLLKNHLIVEFSKNTLGFNCIDQYSINQANDTLYEFMLNKDEPLNTDLWTIDKYKGNDWVGYRHVGEISLDDFNKQISSLYRRRNK